MSPRKSTVTKRLPTSVDVARAARVAQSTVSLVLNNTPGQTISASTRKRVLQAAHDLGYRPNLVARALRKGRSDEICLYVSGALYSNSTLEWIIAIRERARQLGYSLYTCFFNDNSKQEWKNVQTETSFRHPAGIIGSSLTITSAYYQRTRKMGILGCALISAKPIDYAPTIRLPYAETGALAGTYFREQGHQIVGYLAPSAPDSFRQTAFQHCVTGLESALSSGATLAPLPMDGTLDCARKIAAGILRSPERPTAIYSYRDDYCFPLLRALLESGLRVPQDVALVGTGNSPLGSFSYPSLTSIRFDWKGIGYHLVDIVDALIHNRQPLPEWLTPPSPELIVRESA